MIPSKAVIRAFSALQKVPQLHASAGVRITSRQFSSVRTSHRPQVIPPVRWTLTTLRFNSTTTTLPTTPAAVAAADQAGAIPEHNIPENNLPEYIPTVESLTSNLTNPEHIGYLQSLGLDYGFGPTTMLQTLLESVHIFSATPWWASIMLTVAMIRITQFPFYMRMSETAARMKEVNPQVLSLMRKAQEAQARGDIAGLASRKQQISNIYRSAGIRRLWIGFPITQLPIFYGFYKNLYGMAEAKVPGLVNGGSFWFQDLTMHDPYFILPLVSSALMALQIHLGGEAGSSMQSKRAKRVMILIIPFVSFLVVNSWPAALTLYFFTNSVFGIIQATALRDALVREKLGLYPLDPAAAKNPLSPSGTVHKTALETLNIATRPGPSRKMIDSSVPKQIGAKGGFLDGITGGTLRKDGTKKTFMDYLLGEKVEGYQEGTLEQRLRSLSKNSKYIDYEKKRERRLKKEAEEDVARRGMKP